LADDKDTAIAEIRPWRGAFVTVGKFRICRDIKLVDCSIHSDQYRHCSEEQTSEEREEAVWKDIDLAFSEPTTNNNTTADYAPTQILSELFRNNGFDGIIYRSCVGNGLNVALFDLNNAKLISRELCEVTEIKVSCKEAWTSAIL